MEPLFTQKWLLFAPEPATSELRLWYRIKIKNKWLEWQDPIEPVLKKHQRMRFTYNAKLLYVYGNIPRNLAIRNDEIVKNLMPHPADSNCIKGQMDSLLISPEFKLAKKYVKNDLKNSTKSYSIDSLQIMIIRLYPKQFSERLSNKPFGYASPIEFPPIRYNEDD